MCSRRWRRVIGFTLIELLVVISIISVLAGMLIPIIQKARGQARQKACIGHIKDLFNGCELYMNNEGATRWVPLWLTQLADYGYCGALRDTSRRIPSDPGYDKEGMDQVLKDCVLACPSDGNYGSEGGRPNSLLYSDGGEIQQYYGADVDAHAGGPLGYQDSEHTENRVPCSYLYEFNSELVDFLYEFGNPYADTKGEFEGCTWDSSRLVEVCDLNGDMKVSWYELKIRTVKGNRRANLKSWGTRVPFLRCYWHVPRPYLHDDSKIISVTYGGDARTGGPQWYRN